MKFILYHRFFHTCVTLLILLSGSCKDSAGDFDASGTFEGKEIIVSAETVGRIVSMNAREGIVLAVGQPAVIIDTTSLVLQVEQVEAGINALDEKTASIMPYIRTLEQQLVVQETQLRAQERERERIAALYKEDAATRKQVDDAETMVQVAREQMELTRRQLDQQKAVISTQNRSVLSEQQPLEKRKAQLQDQIDKAVVRNPVSGTVLTTYAEAGEFTAPGKALYKIADLRTMILRAYISGEQLPAIKPGQKVKVYVDREGSDYAEYPGTVTWISDKAEFTPKTIMTRDERANLVYAVKIEVLNDKSIKIGMYGDVKF